MVKRKVHPKVGHSHHGNTRPRAAGSLAAKFQLAVAAHEQGRLDHAEALYREILQAQPKHFDTLLFLGHLYLHSGRMQQAVELTRASIVENMNHPAAHFNLGLALINLGQHADAIGSLDRAVALMPDYAEAHCNRGIALQNFGQHPEAIASFDRAIECSHDNPIAYNNRGISLQKLGRHPEAITSFDRALELGPENGVACNNRGISLLALKRNEDALASFKRALELIPDYAEAYSNRGLALQQAGRDDEAIDSFDRALELNPDSSMAYSNRGLSLLKLRRDDEAMASLDRALGAPAGSPEVFINRAVALQSADRFEDALRCFNQALTFDPGHAGALNHRGNVLRNLNRNAEALASYDASLASGPGDASTHLNASLCRLLLGDFERGWEAFEWRWKTDQYREAQRTFPQPLWLGKEVLKGKTILLHAEQGLGDTIQFCRYAKLAAAAGATVLLEVQPALKPALAGLEGVSRVLATGEPLPAFDLHCPLMSLPLAFNTRLNSIPAHARYVSVDAERVARWRTILGQSSRLRVGLAWSGNVDFANDQNRSIPLETFAKLVCGPAQFVSLQRDVRPADQPVLKAHSEIIHFGDELHDFSDTAALVENMDLVISVDTAVAHLAGALGKPVWILLPFNCDWRWLVDRSDSPWYPSARLIRQSSLGNWAEVVQQLANDLDVQELPAKA